MTGESHQLSFDRVLEERAKALARPGDVDHDRELDSTVAVVVIGHETFGIPVESLREIVRVPPIARLPHLPTWVAGIAQLRGELLCVVHTALWFHLLTASTPELLAVMEGPEGPVGLLVDAVVGFREVYANEIAALFGRSIAAGGRPIRAVTNDLVALLDAERILRSERVIVDNAGSPPGFQSPVAGG
jgi:purine-binding chemotaxis protein CheW